MKAAGTAAVELFFVHAGSAKLGLLTAGRIKLVKAAPAFFLAQTLELGSRGCALDAPDQLICLFIDCFRTPELLSSFRLFLSPRTAGLDLSAHSRTPPFSDDPAPPPK
jgi:hypothetical protein